MVVISYMEHMNNAYIAMVLYSANIQRLRTAHCELPSRTKIALKTVLPTSDTAILYHIKSWEGILHYESPRDIFTGSRCS